MYDDMLGMTNYFHTLYFWLTTLIALVVALAATFTGDAVESIADFIMED